VDRRVVLNDVSDLSHVSFVKRANQNGEKLRKGIIINNVFYATLREANGKTGIASTRLTSTYKKLLKTSMSSIEEDIPIKQKFIFKLPKEER